MAQLRHIEEILQELLPISSQKHPQDWLPFFVNGSFCGFVQESTAKLLVRAFRFLNIQNRELHFECPSFEIGSRRLAAVSQLLKQEGLVRAWRDELLPVVPLQQKNPEPAFATIERAVCRPFSLTTYAVHLNPFTKDGRLWIAQRSLKKAIGPGLWDNCAAGIVPYGEDFDTAMDREAAEEAGIEPGTFQYQLVNRHLLSRPVTEGWMQENTIVYTAVVPDSFTPHNVDGEVACFKLLDADSIIEMIREKQFTFESSLSTLIAIKYHIFA